MGWVRRKKQNPRRESPEDREERRIRETINPSPQDEADFYYSGGYEAVNKIKREARKKRERQA